MTQESRPPLSRKQRLKAMPQVETVYYVLSPDYLAYSNINQAVNLAILRRFAAERIEFPYPTRTVFFKNDGAAPTVATGGTAGR